jgi:hypothetical protein
MHAWNCVRREGKSGHSSPVGFLGVFTGNYVHLVEFFFKVFSIRDENRIHSLIMLLESHVRIMNPRRGRCVDIIQAFFAHELIHSLSSNQ